MLCTHNLCVFEGLLIGDKMVTDLPDYEKKVVVVTVPGEYPSLVEIDVVKVKGVTIVTPTIVGCLPVSIEHNVKVDHRQILGITLKTPTVAACLPISIEHTVDINHKQILGVALKTPTYSQCVPISIENAAIAYNSGTDRFKVDIEAITVGTLDVNVTDKWARQLGLVDVSRVLGAALSVTNPVIARLSNGTIAIDPRDRNWTITESLARSWNLGSSDIPDLLDKAARLLGIVYGDKGQLAQRTTSKDLYVQLRSAGSEIDPTQIRALTTSDKVSVEQSDETKLKATVTQAAKDRTVTGTVTAEQSDQTKLKATVTQASIARTVTGTVTAEQATAANLKGTVYQSDETQLKATVTQAAKDRTISDITKTATIVTIQATASGNTTIRTPAGGKAIRVKLIDVWNNGAAAITVYLRFAAAGTARFTKTLASYTGFIINLIGTNWEGAADEALIINLSATGTVEVTVMKDEV